LPLARIVEGSAIKLGFVTETVSAGRAVPGFAEKAGVDNHNKAPTKTSIKPNKK
jgi:hypothetical protein